MLIPMGSFCLLAMSGRVAEQRPRDVAGPLALASLADGRGEVWRVSVELGDQIDSTGRLDLFKRTFCRQ